MSNLKFSPQGDKIVLEVEQIKDRTSGGIYLPNMSKEKPITARVVAVGTGRYENGVLIPITIPVGQRVVFTKMVGLPFKCNGKDYITIPSADIVLIVDDDAEIEAATFNG